MQPTIDSPEAREHLISARARRLADRLAGLIEKNIDLYEEELAKEAAEPDTPGARIDRVYERQVGIRPATPRSVTALNSLKTLIRSMESLLRSAKHGRQLEKAEAPFRVPANQPASVEEEKELPASDSVDQLTPQPVASLVHDHTDTQMHSFPHSPPFGPFDAPLYDRCGFTPRQGFICKEESQNEINMETHGSSGRVDDDDRKRPDTARGWRGVAGTQQSLRRNRNARSPTSPV